MSWFEFVEFLCVVLALPRNPANGFHRQSSFRRWMGAVFALSIGESLVQLLGSLTSDTEWAFEKVHSSAKAWLNHARGSRRLQAADGGGWIGTLLREVREEITKPLDYERLLVRLLTTMGNTPGMWMFLGGEFSYSPTAKEAVGELALYASAVLAAEWTGEEKFPEWVTPEMRHPIGVARKYYLAALKKEGEAAA